MNATLQSTPTEKIEPATIAQLAKLNQLVSDQKPSSDRMQQAMRLIPDLLKADLSKVNRYDLCRLIGRELPFQVKSYECEQWVDYDKSLAPLLYELAGGSEKVIEVIEQLKSLKIPQKGKANHQFFIVESYPRHLEGFDLVVANPWELLQSQKIMKKFMEHIYCHQGDLLREELYVWGNYSEYPSVDGHFALRYSHSKGIFYDFFYPDISRKYDETFRYGPESRQYFFVRRETPASQ